MRIVYLNPCAKWGGAETSLRELLASIRVAEPEWELWLLLGEDGPLAEVARALGVRVEVKPFPPALGRLGDSGGLAALWSLVRAVAPTTGYTLSLARWLRQAKPDIVHTNGFKMHLLGAWTLPAKAVLVWHIHDYVGSRPRMSRLLRWFRKACSLAIVNSKSVAADFERLFPGLPVAPIYNAIDQQRFSPAGERLDLDAVSGLMPSGAGTIRVGLVATFARWKGHKVFLSALSQISSGAAIRGYIIGGPIYQTDGSQWSMEELRAEVDRLGLGDRVGFTGFVDNTAAAMRALDIVVHASTQPEPFGMVIIEAMGCGIPVIASQAGGAMELFKDGENGLGHTPGDAAGLARQIERMANDPELRRRIGAAGRARARSLFQGVRMADEVVTVYRKMSGEPAGGRSPAEMQSSVPVA